MMPARRFPWFKVVAALVLASVSVTVFLLFHEQLSLATLADYETDLRAWRDEHPLLTYGFAFLLYASLTGLSVPLATPLTLIYGWLFGFFPAVILISFASTTGATLAFLQSRYLLRDSVHERYGPWLEKVNRELERDGPFYLFTLRLIPQLPFVIINLVMGLTPLSAWTFWWVSQLGMLPGTCLYVWAGSTISLDTLAKEGAGGILTPQLFAAFIALGLFPLATRWVMKRWKPGA